MKVLVRVDRVGAVHAQQDLTRALLVIQCVQHARRDIRRLVALRSVQVFAVIVRLDMEVPVWVDQVGV